ncbi:MAG TPA: endonuclease/exonuclease/phosphatase family protein, partial [Pyrinomonadaceae bacterium]
IDPHASLDGQHDQLQVVLAKADDGDGPTLVMGDFNTLSSQKCVETRRFMEAHGYTTPFPTGTDTWRGAAIRLHADWIFVRGAEVKRWGVARPLNVSDHWPVWAEVLLPNAI